MITNETKEGKASDDPTVALPWADGIGVFEVCWQDNGQEYLLGLGNGPDRLSVYVWRNSPALEGDTGARGSGYASFDKKQKAWIISVGDFTREQCKPEFFLHHRPCKLEVHNVQLCQYRLVIDPANDVGPGMETPQEAAQ